MKIIDIINSNETSKVKFLFIIFVRPNPLYVSLGLFPYTLYSNYYIIWYSVNAECFHVDLHGPF